MLYINFMSIFKRIKKKKKSTSAIPEIWFLGCDFSFTPEIVPSVHSNIQPMFTECLLCVKYLAKH